MTMELRKAIPSHKTGTSDGSWDGPANEARLKTDQDLAYYSRAYAWRDAEGDESKKSTYKFIHHEVDGEGDPGPSNNRACITGIAVLNGARGGTTIPDADRQGVYNHLAAHLRDAHVEPPELKGFDTGDVERRAFPFESRIVGGEDGEGEEEGKPPKIEGHAAVFNQLSEEMWGFRERIAPGAFAKTLKNADIRALFNHDVNFVLGRNKAGTLELKEDEKGLFTEITPPNTNLINDLVLTPMRRGDVNQMSFGFMVDKEEWTVENDIFIRTIEQVTLFDVSIVTFPAYPQTDAHVRSILNSLATAGLNYEALSGILFRAQRGQPLTDADRDLISASIETLKRFIPVSVEPELPESELPEPETPESEPPGPETPESEPPGPETPEPEPPVEPVESTEPPVEPTEPSVEPTEPSVEPTEPSVEPEPTKPDTRDNEDQPPVQVELLRRELELLSLS
jgi:hypothetical protein